MKVGLTWNCKWHKCTVSLILFFSYTRFNGQLQMKQGGFSLFSLFTQLNQAPDLGFLSNVQKNKSVDPCISFSFFPSIYIYFSDSMFYLQTFLLHQQSTKLVLQKPWFKCGDGKRYENLIILYLSLKTEICMYIFTSLWTPRAHLPWLIHHPILVQIHWLSWKVKKFGQLKRHLHWSLLPLQHLQLCSNLNV